MESKVCTAMLLPCQRIVCKRNARTEYDERKRVCAGKDMNLGSHMVVLSSPKVVVVVDQLLKRLKGSTTVLSGSSS